MEKSDAVRKARALKAMADDPRTGAHEAEGARQLMTKLQEKYDITDADLGEEPEEFSFFGHKLFFFNHEIQPHLNRIQEEIDAALAKADTLDIQNKLDCYSHFYRDMRVMVEGATYQDRLKQRRDVVVREYYEAEKERYKRNDAQWIKPDQQEPIDWAYRDIHYHTHARNYTAIYSGIRKDTIERIVGVSEKDLTLKAQRFHTCFGCGLDGHEGRAPVGVFPWPLPDNKHNQEWAHKACAEEASRSDPGT